MLEGELDGIDLKEGKTPMKTFLDSLPLAREEMLNQTIQTTTDVV